ncbi:uncharacterized protein LOC106161776 [Lingula anatina]|uniref:chitin synthase n=1 Tax=Lingula anatina TaxID=7574 RepID=A0A1S3I7S5_LINAN|nr:uncharacterized protein LOC106161776 [Lingula anatina]XP_013394248.1 uncharacterized protein LOC106161776 [Lingula anatina]|eukprot:XP_013394247.1 uncharacterized protein LOC106161776 [Lingula anatina]
MSDEDRTQGGVGEDNSTVSITEGTGTTATTKAYDFRVFRKKTKKRKQPDDEESTVDKCCSVISLLLFGIVTLVIIIAGVASNRILIVVSISKIKENRTYASNHSTASKATNLTTFDDEKAEKLRWYCLLLGSMLAPVVLGFIGSVSSACFQSARKKGTKFMAQDFSDQLTEGYVSEDKKMPLGAFAKRIISLIVLTSIPEILHSGGMCLFVFKTLLEIHTLDIMPLFYATGLVPALLLLIIHIKSDRQSRGIKSFDILLDILVVLIQLGCVVFICWNWDSQSLRNFAPSSVWTLPVAILLISFGWWENFVNTDAKNYISVPIKNFKTEMRRHRSLIYSYVLFFKMIATLCFALGILNWNGFSVEDIQRFLISDQSLDEIERVALISVGCILGFAALLSYLSIFLTCTMGIPKFGYVCVVISMIVSAIGVFIPMCSEGTSAFIEKYTPDQTLGGVIRRWLVGSLSPNCDPHNPSHVGTQIGLYIALLLSHLLLNRHVWSALGKTAIPSLKWIFVQPLYCGILLEQSFMFRRRLPKDVDVDGGNVDSVEDVAHIPSSEQSEKKKPMVYACGTMWHESEIEMRQMLASIIRLDTAVKKEDSIFDYETHIMFDDAFTYTTETTETETKGEVKKTTYIRNTVNNYVNSFFRIILEDVFGQDVDHEIVKRVIRGFGKARQAPDVEHNQTEQTANVEDNTRTPATCIKVTRTPYGGRLEIKMNNTTLYVHLKDKDKIRHRKRWSQVMYMYYLLQYNTNPENPDRKHDENDLDNVYLLALDGDVDFHADALTSLVKEMASDKKLGAACGRIHPIGSGPMVWYQKFEYAIGHWLQKSAEHVLGCVLCSPGCFSLFRGKAVMEVIDIYSNRPKKAVDYLQFDQGEDRWLCTLLLQNGRSIKYCAASDAWTYAPETFSEFYNQRRRWSVSTIANLYDLLSNGWQTSTRNDNISFGFIVYQALLLVSTLLGPATVLMAISTSITTLLVPNLSNDTAGVFVTNGIILLPIIFYIWVSFTQTKNVQLNVATILSGMYALLMVATLVGIIVEVGTNVGSMSSIIFLILVAVFVTTALIHPKELYCVFYGLLYFVAIPSMYVFLTIYSLSNLNDVSWGTRETPKLDHDSEGHGLPRKVTKSSEDGFNCDSFFGCICRCRKDNAGQMENGVASQNSPTYATADKGSLPPLKAKKWNRVKELVFKEYTWTSAFSTNMWHKQTKTTVNLKEQNKYEYTFWKHLIKFRLEPIDKNADEEILKKDLKTLRNNSMIFVLSCNAVWIAFTILIQNQSDILIRWRDHNGYEQKSDVLSLLFLSLFILMTIIQFICMLWHRFWTLIHYMSTAVSSLKFGKNRVHPLNDNSDMNGPGTSENRSGGREAAYVSNTGELENRQAISASSRQPVDAETSRSGATHLTHRSFPLGFLEPAANHQINSITEAIKKPKNKHKKNTKTKRKGKTKKNRDKKSNGQPPSEYVAA